jgi:cyclopropane fatty-acyl-phospholipid synthase-like methyltransferase
MDAGCGVGGSAIYLAQQKNAKVSGVTLSDLQVKTARQNIEKYNLASKVRISKQDYGHTSFESATFDVVWACESLSSSEEKANFISEAIRLLKPGGRMIIADFYRTENQVDQKGILKKWSDSWAMAELVTSKNIEKVASKCGFKNIIIHDYTRGIYKTANRLYWSYLIGKWPSRLYNFIFGARTYARNHYMSGYYQYKALQSGLWKYKIILALKK